MADNVSNTYDIEVFFDGDCPLCRREIRFLQRRDRHHRIRFTDLDAPDYRPADVGRTRDELMAQMHGQLPDGTWLTGVEVFRRMYAAIGLGPLVRLSRLPLISQLLDIGYSVFAHNRLQLTGRCTAAACPSQAEGGEAATVKTLP